MDRYTARITLHGVTQRERNINRLRNDILKNLPENPSYKKVLLNGVETYISITKGTQRYYKDFQSLPGQKIIAGDYINWAHNTWLVYTADCDDEIYTDGELRQCNYVQRWQNENGELVERPSYVVNASAYNNGETGNSTITLASNQFMVYMPLDEETLKIRNGKRVFMDYFLDGNSSSYELTRPDNVSMKFGEKGVTYYIFTQCPKNSNRDKLITLQDGNNVWIADYIESSTTPSPTPPDEIGDLSVTITGGDVLRCGRSKSWSATFKDSYGNNIDDCDFKWNVISDFNISQIINGNKIQLRMDDEDFISSSFLLQIIMVVDGLDTVVAENRITVIDGF